MCEFKVVLKNDNSQIGEEILLLGYSENNELLFKDILGMGGMLDSALILDVDVMTQKVEVLEHPLIKNFIGLIKKITANTVENSDLEAFQNQLEALK